MAFESGGEEVAEIDMERAIKKQYQLIDYPSVDQNRTYDSIGATVNDLAITVVVIGSIVVVFFMKKRK